MKEEIICQHCGLVNDYRTEMKSNQNTAWCNGCEKFIKNISYRDYSNLDEIFLPFGKYKDIRLSTINDISYLKWAVSSGAVKKGYREAVEKRISQLTQIM